MIPSPSADLESLQSAVVEIRVLLGELSLRVSELEARLPVATSAAAAPSGSTSADPGIPAAASALGAERVSAAQSVGDWLVRCLEGRHRGLSGRERVKQPSKFYLVVRDNTGTVHNPPLVFTTWRDTRDRVHIEGDPGDSIFVGLPTKEEGRIALLRAGLTVPSALQRA